MTLPENANFSNIQELAVLQLAYEDNFIEKNKERLIKLFGIDASTIHVNDHGTGKTELHESDDEKNRKYFAVENGGFVSFISGMTYSYTKDEVTRIDTVEKYETDTDNLTQKRISFGKEEAFITDVIDTAEKWLEKNMPLENLNYRISDVYVRDFELPSQSPAADGEALAQNHNQSGKQLSFFTQINYKGMPLDPYTGLSSFDQTGNAALTNTGVNLNYEGKEELTFFANMNGRITFRSAEPITKVVDLETAARLVNEKLAGFHEIKIDKLLPLYALWPQYEKKGEFEFSMPGQKVEGRPVYAFLINMDYNGIQDFGNDRCAEHFIYVDMVTGEVTTDFDHIQD